MNHENPKNHGMAADEMPDGERVPFIYRDPTTAEQIMAVCHHHHLLRSEDVGPVRAFLIAREDFHARNPGKKFRPQFGLIYCLQEPLAGLIKIGRGNNPIQRPRCQKSGTPTPSTLLRVLAESDGLTETDLHKRFERFRVPDTREWYFPAPAVVKFAGGEPRRVLWDPTNLAEVIRELENEMAAGKRDVPSASQLMDEEA